MKLGLLTAPFPTTPLEEVADWAAANGFSMLEVCAWPSGEGATRRYGGICHIDVDGLSDQRASEIVDDLAQRGIEISGLGYYPNPLHPDLDHRQAVLDHLKKVITGAAKLGVPVVNTFIGADQSRSQRDNWEEARKIWPEIVDHANDSGVRIAIENCPMIFSADEWPSGHNLAYSPSMWRTMFEEFGETVGLNFDPSHLVWQMIDMESAIDEFGQRFYHVHAKDLEVDVQGLYEHGILSAGIGWQVPRLPGLGEVDWRRFFSALYRVGYDHVICVEHEDRKFEGTDELVKRGFLLARDHLSPWIV
jgi:sugar phosphate isomerase/epimerase